MSRYGGSTNVADDFNHLVSAGYASGLNDSQIPEFLSGIQKVMEDGIAKGFSRSATEVADTMLMFSKFSGNNAFWQGEQGAKLINQASAGLAGATAMSKTTDLIAFGAINRAFSTRKAMEGALGNNKDLYMSGSNYVNEMMILEQGLNKDNFGALMGGIYKSTGNDEGRVERIRQMFGLNYTGARRIQDLYDKYQNKKYDANFEKELSKITTSPENQNDETAYRKSVNKIAEVLQTMGKPVFNLELTGIQNIEGLVSKIEKFLSLDYEDKLAQQESEDLMDSFDDRKMSIVTSNMKYFGDKKEGVNRLKTLADWNGFGRIPGLSDDHIFNNEPVGTYALTGESGEGAWSLDRSIGRKNSSDLYEFISLGFGNEILDYYNGNEIDADAAIRFLSDAQNKKSNDVRGDIADKSGDRVYMKSEQEKTLTKILELLQSGIDINEYRQR